MKLCTLVGLVTVMLSSSAVADITIVPLEKKPVVAIDAGPDAAPVSPEANASRESLSEAINSGRFSEALRLGADATAKFPDDGWLRYLYGSALLIVLDYEGASAQLSRALELMPRDIPVLIENAELAMARDDLDGADKLLARAHKIDPLNDDLHVAKGDLAALVGVKRNLRSTHQQDTEEFYVNTILREIESGRLEQTLSSRIPSFKGNAKVVAKGLRQAWKSASTTEAAEFVNWEVSRRTRKGAALGEPVVVRLVWRANSAAPMAENLDDALRSMLPGVAPSVVKGLDQADQQAYLDRLKKLRPIEISKFRLAMQRIAGQWAISDIYPADTEQSTLMLILGLAETGEANAAASKSWGWTRIGGMAAILLLAVGILIWLSRRKDSQEE